MVVSIINHLHEYKRELCAVYPFQTLTNQHQLRTTPYYHLQNQSLQHVKIRSNDELSTQSTCSISYCTIQEFNMLLHQQPLIFKRERQVHSLSNRFCATKCLLSVYFLTFLCLLSSGTHKPTLVQNLQALILSAPLQQILYLYS